MITEMWLRSVELINVVLAGDLSWAAATDFGIEDVEYLWRLFAVSFRVLNNSLAYILI
jgi:predicted phosphohydrolase